MIRVLVVDDHALMRAGVAALLNGVSGIEVVGECSDGNQVRDIAAAVRPHVVLMDVLMPVLSGIDATPDLLAGQPDVRVLFFTGSLAMPTIIRAVQVGASGFVLKGSPDALISAVRTVAAGGAVWPAELPYFRPAEPEASEQSKH